jgi:hypothetical protein
MLPDERHQLPSGLDHEIPASIGLGGGGVNLKVGLFDANAIGM